MDGVTTIAQGLDHAECVAWAPSGWLLAGGEAGQLYRIDVDTGAVAQVGDTGGFILGVAFDADEMVYVCDLGRQAVLRVSMTDGVVADLTSDAGLALLAPNFPVFHGDGRLFFSDSGRWGDRNGRILCRYPDGRVAVVSDAAPAFTNGLAIDPSQRFLYVVQSEQPRVRRFQITDAGLGQPEQVLDLPRTVPDGLAFAVDGTLLIGCYRPDAVYTWDGEKRGTLVSDWTGEYLTSPTNLAFGGSDRQRLFAANLGGWHITELATTLRGAPLRYPRIAPPISGHEERSKDA